MGFANIAANHGWSQSFLGITIVMTGLFILTIAISQIHKLVAFWERRQAGKLADTTESPLVSSAAAPTLADSCPADLPAMLKLYRPLTESLGTPFQLKDLYRLAADYDLPHPHITIRCLREDGHLIALGEGFFNWNE
jgi:Na+-transporting methylmalonyl-CoA/oxaloacetate decarboxylase gamma subunit